MRLRRIEDLDSVSACPPSGPPSASPNRRTPACPTPTPTRSCAWTAWAVPGDPDAAPRELGRVMAPNDRPVITRAARRGTALAWKEQARPAVLTLEHVDERPAEPALWERLTCCRPPG
jgi:hypothetical protein